MTETQKRIIELLRVRPMLATEVAQAINRSRRTALNVLSDMVANSIGGTAIVGSEPSSRGPASWLYGIKTQRVALILEVKSLKKRLEAVESALKL